MKYYIIAGEASGDLHGGNLIRALLAKDPDAVIRFWGGDNMEQAAAAALPGHAVQVRHIRDLAFMGIVEVLSHLSAVLGNIRFCKHDILEFRPDVVVFIDYPGFNLKIAKFTHDHGFRNVHYISPQIWAWKKGRIRPMRRNLDSLCYILPTEQDFYAHNDFPQALYVGHPLLDEVQRYRAAQPKEDAVLAPAGDDRKLIALLPGSRKQELRRLLPIMVRMAANHPEYRFAIAGMSLLGKDYYRQFIPTNVANVDIVLDDTYGLLAAAYAGIICSGTATLETALFRLPQVVCYQCNKISAAIARRLIASRIKYISLVNLIADKPVVCELIQDDYNLQRLETEFDRITSHPDVRQSMMDEYDRVAMQLGGIGASQRTADEIVRVAKQK